MRDTIQIELISKINEINQNGMDSIFLVQDSAKSVKNSGDKGKANQFDQTSMQRQHIECAWHS